MALGMPSDLLVYAGTGVHDSRLDYLHGYQTSRCPCRLCVFSGRYLNVGGRDHTHDCPIETDGDDLMFGIHIVSHIESVQVRASREDLRSFSEGLHQLRLAVDLVAASHSLPWPSELLVEFCETMGALSFYQAYWRGRSRDAYVDTGTTLIPTLLTSSSSVDGDIDTYLKDVITRTRPSPYSRPAGKTVTEADVKTLLQDMVVVANRHRLILCTTTTGRIAFVPLDSKAGDAIVVRPGARAPYVLRRRTGEPRNGKKVFSLVGIGYMQTLNAGVHVAKALGELEAVVIR
jgi:hypothetical protein